MVIRGMGGDQVRLRRGGHELVVLSVRDEGDLVVWVEIDLAAVLVGEDLESAVVEPASGAIEGVHCRHLDPSSTG